MRPARNAYFNDNVFVKEFSCNDKILQLNNNKVIKAAKVSDFAPKKLCIITGRTSFPEYDGTSKISLIAAQSSPTPSHITLMFDIDGNITEVDGCKISVSTNISKTFRNAQTSNLMLLKSADKKKQLLCVDIAVENSELYEDGRSVQVEMKISAEAVLDGDFCRMKKMMPGENIRIAEDTCQLAVHFERMKRIARYWGGPAPPVIGGLDDLLDFIVDEERVKVNEKAEFKAVEKAILELKKQADERLARSRMMSRRIAMANFFISTFGWMTPTLTPSAA